MASPGNKHSMQNTSPVYGLAASTGVWLRATETEISAALVAWEGL